MFTRICQRDYPKLYLGNTKFTMARWGCLSCVVNMAYNWLWDKNKNPNHIVPKLKYTNTGLLRWDLSGVKLRLIDSVRRSSNPYPVIRRWWPNQNVCCAIEIRNGVHFVWQISRWWPGLGYRIVDPIDGRKKWLKYGITGARIITKR